VEKGSRSRGLPWHSPSSAQNQFRRADFPIIQLSPGIVIIQPRRQAVQIFVFDPVVPAPANDDLRVVSRLRSSRKIPIHHKAVQ
jgi:hypothetical protein